MSEATWSLLLAFDTQDSEFARGFEAARFYERCKDDRTNWSTYISTGNAEMVLRIAEATDRAVRSVELGDGWLEVFVT